MRKLVFIIALLLAACGSGTQPDTTINIATGDSSTAGDPMVETHTGCADGGDTCDTSTEQ